MILEKLNNSKWKMKYTLEELKQHGIFIKKDNQGMFFITPPEKIKEFQDMAANDILTSGKIDNALVEMELFFREEEQNVEVIVNTLDENQIEEMSKDKQKVSERGFVYLKVNRLIDIANIPAVFLNSSVLQTTDGDYVLRVLTDNEEKAKIILCEFGELVEAPRNWNIFIRDNAIEEIRKVRG